MAVPPSENGNGVAMSSSPCEEAGEGNEDVAAPMERGRVNKRLFEEAG